MRRIRLTIAYDGTGYHGWQVQPGFPTIQAEMERVFSEIEGTRIHLEASGRTDAGVHAVAQVAAVSMTNPIPCENLRKAANRLLPPAIRVMEVSDAPGDFHPRFQSIAKTYEYRMFRGQICPPFLRNFVCHWPRPLDECRMFELASLFEGEHDFTAFAATDSEDRKGRSKVRNVFSSKAWRDGDFLYYRVRGSGFLKHMVRNLVGVLIEAGKGNVGEDGIRDRLKPACGIPAGRTAPPQGLFLIGVEYPADT